MSRVLVIDQLEKAYRDPVLRGASARFPPGQVVALLGENGSGKTTLFKCLLGLEGHAGSVRFEGAAGDRSPEPGELFGVFDEPTLYAGWTVAENIDYQLNDGRATSSPVVQALVPAPILRARAGQLSAGQTRLVLLAIALASSAPVLLLDEFSNGLDRSTRVRVRQALTAATDAGRTVIASGHDFSIFEGFADRIWILKGGLLHDRTADAEKGAGLAEVYDSFQE